MSEIPQLLQAVILGVLQGLAEFLPISSSAHLTILPQILGWPSMGKAFDVALHFGTLVAIIVMFKDDVAAIFRGAKGLFLRAADVEQQEKNLVKYLILGCIPAGVIGVLFEETLEKYFDGLPYVASMLILWAILLEAADKKDSSEGRKMEELTLKDALIIGCAQAAALMPGTSRSGSTITAALFLGFNRAEAARFSFLLSLPVVAGASLLKGIRLATDPNTADLLGPLMVGILVSGFSGFVCIKYFLKYLKTNSFRPFVIYRILLGIFLLYWAYSH